MKKIIITMFALTLGVCAFAKTLDTLIAEMPKGIKTKEELDARSAYVEANKADFIRELRAYCASELATKKNPDLTDEEKAIRNTLAPAYFAYGKELEIADIVGIRFSIMLWGCLNENGYEKIKANDWKADGIELTITEKRALAFKFNDLDVLSSMDLSVLSKTALLHNLPKVKKLLLNANDANKAKKYCRDYQKAMLNKGISDSSDEFKSLKAIEDYLNRGILFK